MLVARFGSPLPGAHLGQCVFKVGCVVCCFDPRLVFADHFFFCAALHDVFVPGRPGRRLICCSLARIPCAAWRQSPAVRGRVGHGVGRGVPHPCSRQCSVRGPCSTAPGSATRLPAVLRDRRGSLPRVHARLHGHVCFRLLCLPAACCTDKSVSLASWSFPGSSLGNIQNSRIVEVSSHGCLQCV